MKKILLVLSVIIGLLQAEGYDSKRAVKYAQSHTEVTCSDYSKKSLCYNKWSNIYYKYTDNWLGEGRRGTDCSNFISQTIHEAGVEYSFYSNLWYHDSGDDDSVSWINLDTFRNRFLKKKFSNVFKIDEKNVRVGDIIFFAHKKNNDFYHAGIITKKIGNKLYYTAHSIDRDNEYLDPVLKKYNLSVEFWRIGGTFKPSYTIYPGIFTYESKLTGDKTITSNHAVQDIESVNRIDRYAQSIGLKIDYCMKVQIDMMKNGSSIDSYLYLMKNGVVIDYDDDKGGDRNSRIIKTLNPGLYELEATTYSKKQEGKFKLKVTKISNCSSSSDTLYLGSNVTSNITTSTKATLNNKKYAKKYKFELTKNTNVQIDLIDYADQSRGHTLDPYLYLLDKYGRKLSVDDDGGNGRNSRIKTYLNKGTYYIEASSYNESKTGKFILKIQQR